jgi:hypothetical protein
MFLQMDHSHATTTFFSLVHGTLAVPLFLYYHQAMHIVNAKLFKLLRYAAVVFNAILSRIKSSISDSCTSNALISGRIMILRMQRFTIMVSLVGYFIGYVDAQFYYPLGKCLSAANGGDLGCTAKEVTATVTGIEGPLTCIQGTTVKINATLQMDLNAERFDLGVYVGINGTNAMTGGANACLVQSLGPEDAANPLNNPRVIQSDSDKCWDSNSGLVTIIHKNIDVLCTASAAKPGSVSYNSCFVWKTSGPNTNCNISNVLLPNPDSVSLL